MLSLDKIINIFCSIDDFCKVFIPNSENNYSQKPKNGLESPICLFLK